MGCIWPPGRSLSTPVLTPPPLPPPTDFISHSFSIPELQFLFEKVLPDLSGRTLVDVGSRLGAVLYAVSHFRAKKMKLCL